MSNHIFHISFKDILLWGSHAAAAEDSRPGGLRSLLVDANDPRLAGSLAESSLTLLAPNF
jgi:hypothetical protein